MDIYSKYGMVLPDVGDKIYAVAKDAFDLFVANFLEESLVDQRILFHEFISNIEANFGERSLVLAHKKYREDNGRNGRIPT